MKRKLIAAAALAGLLGLGGGTARAQWNYPGGYGGWGGWGASTVGGDEARGLGVFAAGAGMYNLDTAQARAINVDTTQRWNEYMWESQQVQNHKYYLTMMRRKNENIKNLKAIHDRMRDDPSDLDITNGDSLNILLDELTSPKVYKTAVRNAKTHLSPHMIRDIPFQYASEAVTLALDELTSPEDWPVVLRGKQFQAEREAYAKAIDEAVKEDDAGDLTPETIEKAKAAASRLLQKADAVLPAGSQERKAADAHLRALGAMTRMLEKPSVERIIAAVDQYDGATTGELLSFMHTYNLRFGAARSDRQKALYRELYTALDPERDDILRRVGYVANAPTAAPDPNQTHAPAFFKDLDPKVVDPNTKITPPEPAPRPRNRNGSP